MSHLTPRQQRALEVYNALLSDKGYPPSIREFMSAYGASSTSTAYQILDKLRRAGYDAFTRGQSKNKELRSAVWGKRTEATLQLNYSQMQREAEYWLANARREKASGRGVSWEMLSELRQILDGKTAEVAS